MANLTTFLLNSFQRSIFNSYLQSMTNEINADSNVHIKAKEALFIMNVLAMCRLICSDRHTSTGPRVD